MLCGDVHTHTQQQFEVETLSVAVTLGDPVGEIVKTLECNRATGVAMNE